MVGGRKKLFIALLGAVTTALVVSLLYVVVPFYYYYFDLRNHMRQAIATAAVYSDEEIRRSLMEVVRQHGITCGDRDMQIRREGGTIKLSLSYIEGLGFTALGREVTLYSLHFNAAAEGSFR